MHFWGPETIFHNVSPFKKSNGLISHSIITFGQKYLQEIHPQYPLGKYFPTIFYSVDIFINFIEYIHYQVKDI